MMKEYKIKSPHIMYNIIYDLKRVQLEELGELNENELLEELGGQIIGILNSYYTLRKVINKKNNANSK